MTTAPRMRRVRAGETEALIAFIAALNQPGPQHCLHLASIEAGIRADIDKGDIDLTLCFWIAEAAAGWRGAVGVVRDGASGWLYGPWSADAGDGSLRATLLNVAMAAPDLESLQAFTDVRSAGLVGELSAAGFETVQQLHLMQALPASATSAAAASAAAAGTSGGECSVGVAAPAEVASIAALYDAVLPHTGLSGAAMLEYASRAGLLLVARAPDGAVLGSLCLATDAVLREAEVEFLAVWPDARDRGVGTRLLRAALGETFTVRHYDAVNLCVDAANADALGLYTSAGFERRVSGVKQRWTAPDR